MSVTCAGGWFSPGTPVSSTNKTDNHDIAALLLKVAINTIIPPPPLSRQDDKLKYQFDEI
jgi:hypothetical protein